MTFNAQRALVPLFLAPAAFLAADPQPIQSTIESVGLFKNGILVVRETLTVPGPGTYHLDAVPKAIHGTLWFESESLFEARAVTRAEEWPAPPPRDIAQAARQLQDQRVVLTLVGGETLQGTLLPITSSPASAPSPTFHPYMSSVPAPVMGSMIPILTRGGVSYVPTASVQWITLEDAGVADSLTETVQVPTLELIVDDSAAADTTITMTYLSNGMAWAPSYHIDYDESGSATIGVSTIIRNEWRNLDGTRVDLISGFPQIEHSSVTSLLSHEMTLASFFSQISGGSSRSAGITSQMIVTNMAMPMQNTGATLDGAMTGAGEDLHFHDIGPLSIANGSAISRQLASAATGAKRFVEWRIRDSRDEYGRIKGGDQDQEAWDSIRFTNPFEFPITTAPVSVWIDDKFRGQSTVTFTNPGASAVVKTTKALSVETSHEEFDMERGDPVRVLHSDYQPVTVRAEMKVTNRRAIPATVEIAKTFQGTMQSASDEPAQHRSISRRDAANPSSEARWVIEVPAGEERLVTLDYEVLVRI